MSIEVRSHFTAYQTIQFRAPTEELPVLAFSDKLSAPCHPLDRLHVAGVVVVGGLFAHELAPRPALVRGGGVAVVRDTVAERVEAAGGRQRRHAPLTDELGSLAVKSLVERVDLGRRQLANGARLERPAQRRTSNS